MVAVSMTLLIGFLALVVDSGLAYAEKRKLQTAADAAALAAVQDIAEMLVDCDGEDDTCREAYRTDVETRAETYSLQNGGPTSLDECDVDTPTNCYTWPFEGSWARVEVRVGTELSALFAGFFGYSNPFFHPRARAVAAAQAITETVCPPDGWVEIEPEEPADCIEYSDPIGGIFDPGTDATCDFSESPVPVPNPELYPPPACLGPYFYEDGVDGAVAFTMSRACNAMTYTGAGGGQIGSFVTNGSLDFQGATPKKVFRLGYNRTGCPTEPASPPSGTAACTATIWGDASDSNNACVKNLTDFSSQVPMNWPVRPPSPFPAPIAKNLWNAAAHFPERCMDLGAASITFTPSAAHTATSGPPGVYCLTGANRQLTLNGDFTAGDGYTFFALNGSRIHVASSGTRVKYHWPPGCGPRPLGRVATYTCYSRIIFGCHLNPTGPCYEPETLLWATLATRSTSNCSANAICIDGSNSLLDGDMYAMEPSTLFPPPNPTTVGAMIWVAGGSSSSGSGFLQAWWVRFEGNTGNYTGTGMGIGGQQQQVQGILRPGEDAHCVFDPPLDPDEYPDPPVADPCVIPGAPNRWAFFRTIVVGADIGMDN